MKLAKTNKCVLGFVVFSFLSSCAGNFTSNGEGSEEAAKNAFSQNVMPILNTNCSACHIGTPNIDFMAPDPDTRTKMLEWPNLWDADAPSASRLVTYGQHSGPAFREEDQLVVVEWLELEKLANSTSLVGEEEEELRIDVFVPVEGNNTVDLAPVGAPGATITFNKESLSSGLYLSDLRVNAASEKLKVKHPLFVTWVEDRATPDPLDRFANIDLRVEPNESEFIAGGTAIFVGIDPASNLSIHFEEVGPDNGAEPDDDDVGGGGDGLCKDVASFTQNARQPLIDNCAGCHGGGNQSATSAVDMSDLDDLGEQAQSIACSQILNRVNLANPQQSGLFIAVDPNGGSGHPFQFNGNVGNFNNFRDNIIQWINQEVSE